MNKNEIIAFALAHLEYSYNNLDEAVDFTLEDLRGLQVGTASPVSRMEQARLWDLISPEEARLLGAIEVAICIAASATPPKEGATLEEALERLKAEVPVEEAVAHVNSSVSQVLIAHSLRKVKKEGA